MASKVRLGVIGCGGIAARRTIPEITTNCPSVDLAWVMDVDGSRACQVAEQFGVAHACAGEAELLASDVEAVYIASPPAAHCGQVLAAAKAGKHVLCEKPLALSGDEVGLMERACRQNGVKFALGFCMRHNPYHQKARHLVLSGAIGRPVMGRAQLTCWYPPISGAWRQNVKLSGGGALIDMGTHCLDLLEWIFSSPIRQVVAFEDQVVQRYPTPVEDSSAVLVRFENGAQGIIDNYYNLPDAAAQNVLELHGTGGSILAQGTIGQSPGGTMRSILQPQAAYDASQKREPAAVSQEYQLQGPGIYGQMVEEFCCCIRDDIEPLVGPVQGRHSVKLVEAIYRSACEKRVVEVD